MRSTTRSRAWKGADLTDDHGVGKGHFPDSDSTWEQLVKDPSWYGDWCYGYLDPAGFRYYLPPGMIRNLLGDYRVNPEVVLTERGRFMPDEPHDSDADRWAVLDERQIQVVRLFLGFMTQRLDSAGWEGMRDEWERYAADRS